VEPQLRKIRFSVAIPLLLLHVGAIAALFYFNWTVFVIAVVTWQISGILGITVGYHRLLAHQSFKTYKWVARFHAFCGVLSFQQGPISWVRLHRAHHGHADKIGDPHPQQYGFLFGHLGWPIVDLKGVGESGLRITLPAHLKSDKVIFFLERHFLVLATLSLLTIYLFGGLAAFLWVGCFRIVWTLHVTLMVNSICHRFGYRNFPTDDNSRNNLLVALVTGGEGWHNNHHKFPASPKSGVKWWELDTSWWWILFLSKMGLAWDLRLPDIYVSDEPIGQEIAN